VTVHEVIIQIINRSANELPAYATEGSSGMDVRAHLSAPVRLNPLERVLIPTGLFAEIPVGYEWQVRPRSGLAVKQGITCLNTPGTIDSDYRGEIKVLLVNLSQEPQYIANGDRIAQLVLAKVEKANLMPAITINETQRGEGGFGHTGKS
jgi:dUTP pyrophosphatase